MGDLPNEHWRGRPRHAEAPCHRRLHGRGRTGNIQRPLNESDRALVVCEVGSTPRVAAPSGVPREAHRIVAGGLQQGRDGHTASRLQSRHRGYQQRALLADADGSGRFTEGPTDVPPCSGTHPVPSGEAASEGESTSSSSTSASVVASGGELATSHVGSLILNGRSGLIHRDGDDGALACGRVFPRAGVFASTIPERGTFCANCFRGRLG